MGGSIFPDKLGNINKREKDVEKLFKHVIDDLREIAIKWGYRYVDDDRMAIFLSKDFGSDFEITIVADLRQKKQTIIVRKGSERTGTHKLLGGGELLEGEVVLFLEAKQEEKVSPGGLPYIEEKEEGVLIWDKRISMEDAIYVIVQIDSKAKEKGLLDKKTGKRLELSEPIYIAQEKYRVEEVFSGQGTLYPIMSERKPEKVLQEFDDPESLITRHNPYDGTVIGLIHKRDLEYFEMRDEVLNEILIERNLTVKDMIEGLSMDPGFFTPLLLALREEIDKRMVSRQKKI